jgi:hypothetical protein
MKKFISFLSVIVILSACRKQEILDPAPQQAEVKILSTETPVTFTYNSNECERPEIIFRGETFSDITTITSDSTILLREDQQYTVTFRLKAERCTSGAIILGGENAEEVNIWLAGFPASGEKQHVNLESKYNVVVLGE